MFAIVARSATVSASSPGPKYSTNLPTTPVLPQQLGDGQDEVGRGRAFGHPARQPEADDLRDEHRDRLAEHRRLRLDPAGAPAEDAQAVDHRRVRVGADERVRERLPVARLDDPRQVLEIDLVDDPGVRRHDAQAREGVLAPAQEGIALAVALVVALDVLLDREPRREGVDLDRVVDHELRREQRVDLARVAAEVHDRVAHRREVDDRGNAREVLQEHARRPELELAAGLGGRVPGRDRVRSLLVAVPERVLQEHAQRVGQTVDVLELRDLVARAGDVEGAHAVDSILGPPQRARAAVGGNY